MDACTLSWRRSGDAHCEAFHPDSLDEVVQLSTARQNKMEGRRFILSDWEEFYAKCWPGLVAGAASLASVFQGVAREYHGTLGKLEDKHADWLCNHTLEGILASRQRYHVFGADVLVLDDFSCRKIVHLRLKGIEHNMISAMASETWCETR